jgi:hypothetical protein
MRVRRQLDAVVVVLRVAPRAEPTRFQIRKQLPNHFAKAGRTHDLVAVGATVLMCRAGARKPARQTRVDTARTSIYKQNTLIGTLTSS